MHIIYKIFRSLDLTMIGFAMLCLVAMSLITVVNVLLRYVFNSGLQWGEEITLVLVVWFTFIAFAMGVKLDLHININVLPQKLPKWLNIFLDQLRNVSVLVSGIVFLVYGIILVGFTSRSILPATGLPASIMYLPMPITAVLIIQDSLGSIFGLDMKNKELQSFFSGETSDVA